VVLSSAPTHADIDDALVLAGAFRVRKLWKVDWKEEATLVHRIQPASSAFCVIVTNLFGAFNVHNAKAIGRLVNPFFGIPSPAADTNRCTVCFVRLSVIGHRQNVPKSSHCPIGPKSNSIFQMRVIVVKPAIQLITKPSRFREMKVKDNRTRCATVELTPWDWIAQNCALEKFVMVVWLVLNQYSAGRQLC
jgi:hypothetical protein